MNLELLFLFFYDGISMRFCEIDEERPIFRDSHQNADKIFGGRATVTNRPHIYSAIEWPTSHPFVLIRSSIVRTSIGVIFDHDFTDNTAKECSSENFLSTFC